MNTYEQAKKNIARAEELAQAVKDGRIVEFKTADGGWASTAQISEDIFFDNLSIGTEYRILEPKRRRPWTSEEAERHVGWVLVGPSGFRGLILGCNQHVILHGGSESNPSYEVACKHNWRVHLPGQPDELKPCWVEE